MLVGPPAVGKMTVGHALAARTGLRLFHNHHTIDLALRFFPYGSPPFQRLVGEFRRRIFEEVAASDLPGLIFTYVWAFGQAEDATAVEALAGPFRARGGRTLPEAYMAACENPADEPRGSDEPLAETGRSALEAGTANVRADVRQTWRTAEGITCEERRQQKLRFRLC